MVPPFCQSAPIPRLDHPPRAQAIEGDWTAVLCDRLKRYYHAGLRPIVLWGLLVDGSCACGSPDCGNSRGKHPVHNGWQRIRPSLSQQLAELGRGPRNLGLAMGLQPNGNFLVAIDCDGPDTTLDALRDLGGDLPPTRTSRTARGHHFLYATPDNVAIGNRQGIVPNVDIRGQGGQIVAPPSVHYSGHVYRWVSSTPIAMLPEQMACVLASRPAPTVYPRPALLDPSRLDSNAFARARKYLNNCPVAVAGQRGHQHTFVTVLKLATRFGELSPDELWVLLCEWNLRCLPPWSEKELAHKLSNALEVWGKGTT